jgi:hypothetical protein
MMATMMVVAMVMMLIRDATFSHGRNGCVFGGHSSKDEGKQDSSGASAAAAPPPTGRVPLIGDIALPLPWEKVVTTALAVHRTTESPVQNFFKGKESLLPNWAAVC